MLGSRLHPKSPNLVWQVAIPRSLILLILFHLINGANVVAQQLQNITIPVTASPIIYTPFVCNASIALDNPQPCSGAWQLSSSNDSISTTGLTSNTSGSIIPQLFFEFHASRLTINTLPSSNASVNITISAGRMHVSNVFKSSHEILSIVGLMQNETTLLSVTYIPSTEPTIFGLESFIMTVPDNTTTSSLFPTPTLLFPTSILPSFSSNLSSFSSILPTFISISAPIPSSTSTSSSSSNKTMVAQAVGITVGLGVGLTAIAVALFYYWKRRKQASKIENAKSGWKEEEGRLSRLASYYGSRSSRQVLGHSHHAVI